MIDFFIKNVSFIHSDIIIFFDEIYKKLCYKYDFSTKMYKNYTFKVHIYKKKL